MDSMKPIKRAVIREEYVEIVGVQAALVLSQMVYWASRSQGFADAIREETRRHQTQEPDSDTLKGWVYKTSKDMSDELMGVVGESTCARAFAKLVECGVLESRHNPRNKWDRTLQYRVSFMGLQAALLEKGFVMSGYNDVVRISPSDDSISLPEKSISLPESSISTGEKYPESTSESYSESTNRDTPPNPLKGEAVSKERKARTPKVKESVEGIIRRKVKPGEPTGALVEDAFERFWEEYPDRPSGEGDRIKPGKAAARREFILAVYIVGRGPEALVDSARALAAHVKAESSRRKEDVSTYELHAERFLSKGRYLDYSENFKGTSSLPGKPQPENDSVQQALAFLRKKAS